MVAVSQIPVQNITCSTIRPSRSRSRWTSLAIRFLTVELEAALDLHDGAVRGGSRRQAREPVARLELFGIEHLGDRRGTVQGEPPVRNVDVADDLLGVELGDGHGVGPSVRRKEAFADVCPGNDATSR